jgi:hypothetical protein
MSAGLGAVLAVFMRWLHIASVVSLIGGFIYARFGIWPALAVLPAGQDKAFIDAAILRFRALLWTVLATTLISGLFNYLTKPTYPPHYHMIIGIKFLFVLHIFAVAILYTLPGADLAKRRRWLTGLVISGLIVIAISADLRWLSQGSQPVPAPAASNTVARP